MDEKNGVQNKIYGEKNQIDKKFKIQVEINKLVNNIKKEKK